MPTVALSMSSSSKPRNPSIMDTDPAIMDAGRNPFRPVTFDNVLKDNNPADGTAAKQPSKSNSAFINKMKISGPLKMKGLKTKAFFRTDRSSLLPSSEGAKPAPPAAAPSSVGAGSRSSRSDSSSTTLDEEEDSWFSSPSSGAESFRQSWSSKTKAMFSSGVPKFNPVVAALKKSQLSKTASTSSFEAVSKLDSTSSHMDVASESSVHEVANMSVSSVAEESDKSLDGESHCSDLDQGESIQGRKNADAAALAIAESPQIVRRATTDAAKLAALNAPKPGSHRGSQRQLSVGAVGGPVDLADDVFDDEEGRRSAAKVSAAALRGSGAARVLSLGIAETTYAREIILYFLKMQKEYQAMIPYPNALGTLARGDTRAILISWIVQVHDYEGLENESLYLTVRITDTYCSVHDVILAEIQLVGIAAIFIACKQEERFPPEGKDLVRYTNNAYNIDDLYRMELAILDRLKFKVNMPICWTFATYLLSLQAPRPSEVDWMTHYLLELSLLSKPLIVVLPSLVASAAVYMARFLFLDDETEDPWPTSLSIPATHNLVQLRPVVNELLTLLQATPNTKFNASFLKYSSESKYRGLSKMPVLHNSYSLKRLAAACFGGGGLQVATNVGPPD